MKTIASGFAAGLLFLAASQIVQNNLSEEYNYALHDSRDPQPNEIIGNLTAITESNPDLIWERLPNSNRVLVATLAKGGAYRSGQRIEKSNGLEIWVTVVPEVKDFCQSYSRFMLTSNGGDLKLRLKQVLGLLPDEKEKYDEIAEIWVDLRFLRRPALDPEIDDQTVSPIQINSVFSSSTDEVYKAWFNKKVAGWMTSPYVWTGLGYTYDWGIYPKTNLQTDAGLSEFVILPNNQVSTEIHVKSVFSVEDYCKAG
jgi:hypothetical protein